MAAHHHQQAVNSVNTVALQKSNQVKYELQMNSVLPASEATLAAMALIKQEPSILEHQQKLTEVSSKTLNAAAHKTTSSSSQSNSAMMLDQGAKVTKLLQTPFKAIKLASSCNSSKQTSRDADLALFLAHLQTKIRDGLPQELVNQQIAHFAETSSIPAELISEFLAKAQAEYRIVKNAEKLAAGRKFKGVPPSQISFAPIRDKNISTGPTSCVNNNKDEKKTLNLQGMTVTSGDRTEEIFIDEGLQMLSTSNKSNNKLSTMEGTTVKVEPLNTDFLTMGGEATAAEDSTRSNVVLADPTIKIKSQTGKIVKGVVAPEGCFSDDSDSSMFDFLGESLSQETLMSLARIPIKTNLQQVIEKDNNGQQIKSQEHKLEKGINYHSNQQNVESNVADEPIEAFENEEGQDFCQHPRAGQFLLTTLRQLVSLEDSCHINSVTSAQHVGHLALHCLCRPGFKIERLTILQVLIQTKNQTILKGFVRSGGLQAIHYWLEFVVDQRYEMEKIPSLLEQQLLQRILLVLQKLDLTVEILKEIKVGKLVNSVRLHPNAERSIRLQAEQLIAQWKQLVIDYKKHQQLTLALQQQQLQQHQQIMITHHHDVPSTYHVPHHLQSSYTNQYTSAYGSMPLPPQEGSTGSYHGYFNSPMAAPVPPQEPPTPTPPPPTLTIMDPKQLRRSNVLQLFNSLSATSPSTANFEQNHAQHQAIIMEGLLATSTAQEPTDAKKTKKKSGKVISAMGFQQFTQESNNDDDAVISNQDEGEDSKPKEKDRDQDGGAAAKTAPMTLSQQENDLLERKRDEMVPLLPESLVQEALEQVQRQYAAAGQHAVQITEVEKQANREKFISEVNQPNLMDNPVFTIQGQTESDFEPAFTCDLEEAQMGGVLHRREEKEKTDQILGKLLHILETDPDSIVENKDVFTQILAAVDKETISFIFKAPKISSKTSATSGGADSVPLSLEENKKLAQAVQKQLYQMIMCHYLSCNPILGNFATMEREQLSVGTDKEKEAFYKQAKEFFFTQPFKSPTPQKQYLTMSYNQEATSGTAAANQPSLSPPPQQQSQNPRCQNLMVAGTAISEQSPLIGVPPPLPDNQTAAPALQLTQSTNYIRTSAGSMHHQLHQAQPQTHLIPSAVQAAASYEQQHHLGASASSTTAFADVLSSMRLHHQTQQHHAQQQQQATPGGFGIHHVSTTGSRPKNYRTVPCRMYHGIQGCMRGDTCHFIHDPIYQGVEIPREVLLRIRHENLQKFQTGQLSGIPVYQPGQHPTPSPHHFNFPQQYHHSHHQNMSSYADQATTTSMAAHQQPGPCEENSYNMMDPYQQYMIKTDQHHPMHQQNSSASATEQMVSSPPRGSAAVSGGFASAASQSMTAQAQLAAMQSHPYFNPQFTAQYYQQQEIYKQQQQAQLMASINNSQQQHSEYHAQGTPSQSNVTMEVSDPSALQSSALNLGSIGLANPNSYQLSTHTQSAAAAQAPSQSSVDYQLKLLQDKKTQETHRKLLEQIKSDKEKKKNRYYEKYSRKLSGYVVGASDQQQQQLAMPLPPQTEEVPMLQDTISDPINATNNIDTKQEASVAAVIQRKRSRSRSRSHGSKNEGVFVAAKNNVSEGSKEQASSHENEQYQSSSHGSTSKRQLLNRGLDAVDDERYSEYHQTHAASDTAKTGSSAWSKKVKEDIVNDERERPLTWIEQEEQQRNRKQRTSYTSGGNREQLHIERVSKDSSENNQARGGNSNNDDRRRYGGGHRATDSREHHSHYYGSGGATMEDDYYRNNSGSDRWGAASSGSRQHRSGGGSGEGSSGWGNNYHHSSPQKSRRDSTSKGSSSRSGGGGRSGSYQSSSQHRSSSHRHHRGGDHNSTSSPRHHGSSSGGQGNSKQRNRYSNNQ